MPTSTLVGANRRIKPEELTLVVVIPLRRPSDREALEDPHACRERNHTLRPTSRCRRAATRRRRRRRGCRRRRRGRVGRPPPRRRRLRHRRKTGPQHEPELGVRSSRSSPRARLELHRPPKGVAYPVRVEEGLEEALAAIHVGPLDPLQDVPVRQRHLPAGRRRRHREDLANENQWEASAFRPEVKDEFSHRVMGLGAGSPAPRNSPGRRGCVPESCPRHAIVVPTWYHGSPIGSKLTIGRGVRDGLDEGLLNSRRNVPSLRGPTVVGDKCPHPFRHFHHLIVQHPVAPLVRKHPPRERPMSTPRQLEHVKDEGFKEPREDLSCGTRGWKLRVVILALVAERASLLGPRERSLGVTQKS